MYCTELWADHTVSSVITSMCVFSIVSDALVELTLTERRRQAHKATVETAFIFLEVSIIWVARLACLGELQEC